MAPFTIFRVARFLQSIFVPTATIIGFAFLLTFVFVLYQPTPGPGSIQRLGWQAWDVIMESNGTADDALTDISTGTPSTPDGQDSTVDWWNVTTANTGATDLSSLPLDVWDPLMPHDTGLSEIHITKCMIDPWYAPSITKDICFPDTTKEDDAYKGKWVRVGPSLSSQSSFQSLNVYYRRTRRHDIPLVTDLRILGEHETPSPFSPSWKKVPHEVSPHGEKNYLWYKLEKTLNEMSQDERQKQLVTELDVLFGEDRPWYGFERVESAALQSPDGTTEQSVWLTYRRGVKPPPQAQPLHFSRDGKFKIMQIADLHFSVTPGKCRDTLISPCSHSDNLTSTLLAQVLDSERPDFVVFTGDQLNGQGTTWDAKTVLAKFARAVTDRQIPWAAVFGNHDDEDGTSRQDLMRYMQALPYNLVQAGPPDIHGVGNYVLKVKSADSSMTHLLTLYFLDSGAYSKGFIDWFGFFFPTEYDWIHQDQIDWFLQESASIDPIERPFVPNGAKDFGDLWSRQAIDQLTPDTRRLAKPNAFVFFHIPLQESYAAADINPDTGRPLDVGVHDIEENGSAKKQDGFFHKGLLQALESDHQAGGNAREVKVVSNGHCHITENCRRVNGVWLCFGGGGSYSGYGKIGFDRRFRFYDVSDYGETIRTYKRTESDEILDEMILAGRGAPPFEGS